MCASWGSLFPEGPMMTSMISMCLGLLKQHNIIWARIAITRDNLRDPRERQDKPLSLAAI